MFAQSWSVPRITRFTLWIHIIIFKCYVTHKGVRSIWSFPYNRCRYWAIFILSNNSRNSHYKSPKWTAVVYFYSTGQVIINIYCDALQDTQPLPIRRHLVGCLRSGKSTNFNMQVVDDATGCNYSACYGLANFLIELKSTTTASQINFNRLITKYVFSS